jgi:cytochrome c peroxidase
MNGRFLLTILALLLVLVTACQNHPEAVVEMADDILQFYSLEEPFPLLEVPEANPTTPEKVELGRMLFFDPALSEVNDVACATCHHPDFGFSDGLPRSIGTFGEPVQRNAPTLWNVGFVNDLHWDGGIESLESQVIHPLGSALEMDVHSTDAMIAELMSYPAYVELFEAAFPGESAGMTQVENALAAFQRTLISDNGRFDQFAAGDETALTESEQRGLDLFRSERMQCIACHTPPLFTDMSFRVVGVESSDHGRAAVLYNGVVGSFRVPTLRNVALSAPYMHNGSIATLADVIDFYADGGGRVRGVENMDALIQGFELSEQERMDLIAFLHALTDESNLPEIPEDLPSGLPAARPQGNVNN